MTKKLKLNKKGEKIMVRVNDSIYFPTARWTNQLKNFCCKKRDQVMLMAVVKGNKDIFYL